MGKLVTSLVLVFFLQFILSIAFGIAFPLNTLYDFLINPAQWSLSSLLSLIIGVPGLALTGGVGVIFGTIYRNDLLVFSSITVVLLSFGQSYGELFNIISVQLGFEWAVFFISPIVLIFVLNIISFWRGTTD